MIVNCINSIKGRRVISVKMALFVFFLFWCQNSYALSPPSLDAKAGFDGLYKKGSGSPFDIVLENQNGEAVSGLLRISGGAMGYSMPVQIMPYSQWREWIFVSPEIGNNVLVQFIGEHDVTLRKEIPVIPSVREEEFGVYITKETGRLHSIGAGLSGKDRVFELTPHNLWNMREGYEQADFVLLDAGAAEFMTTAQLEALKQYVLSGGVLYITGRPYPDLYKKEFFRKVLPVVIDGMTTLTPGFLHPGSPSVHIISLKARGGNIVFHTIKNIPLWAEGKKGLGRVIVLSFDPADRSFRTVMAQLNNFMGDRKKTHSEFRIPDESWDKEIRGLYLKLVTWNAGYVLCLLPLGFMGKRGYNKLFWVSLVLIFTTTSLASLGIFNGKNRLRGVTILNVYPEEKNAYIQSGLNILSTGNDKVKAALRGNYFYPAGSDNLTGRHEIMIFPGGINQFSTNMGMLDHGQFIWERFEELENILELNLEVQTDRIKGTMANSSKYTLKNPFLWMNGRFFPLPSMSGGQHISIEINFVDDKFQNVLEEYQWIAELNQYNEKRGVFQDLKIIGEWEKPVLKFDDSNLIIQKEKNILIYNM